MKEYENYEQGISDHFKNNSDGCTFSPDGSWGSCCIIHDHAKLDTQVSAKDADNMLYNCMRDRSNIVLAALYWVAVRFRSITGISPISIAFILVFLSGTALIMKYGG